VPVTAVLLLRGVSPDPVLQALFNDASLRPVFIGEAIVGFILGCIALLAGIMVFTRSRFAGPFLRATITIAIIGLVADMIVQGWIVVPALRRLQPTLKPPYDLLYDPRFRPALPLVIGTFILVILLGIAWTLRRPHVRDALRATRC
jgi:hypothetical protein